MKRLWLACFAVAAVTASASTANAQFNQSPEIGSYQSILARTGYGTQAGSATREAISGTLPGQTSPVVDPVTSASSYAPQAPLGSSSRSEAPQGSSSRSEAPLDGGSYVAPVDGSVPAYGAATPCGTGNCGDSVISGDVASYADYGQGCESGSCGAPVYTPGASVGAIVDSAPNSNQVNRVGGIFGVVLRRNFADPVRIGADTVSGDILSTDIDHGNLEGGGVSLAGRRADGNGREVIYWGLDDDIQIDFNSPAFGSISQLNDVLLPSGNTALENFNNAASISAFRDTEINSIETNLLRNGGSYRTRHGRSGNLEILGGFRLFQFDESLRLLARDGASATDYSLAANNFLVGAQLGARNEVCLSDRFRMTSGINVGLFNNRSETRQQVRDETGAFAEATFLSGPHEFNFENEHDDVAIMGEFKVGLIMQLSDRFRANVGYQALGVSGVALADDQIPLNATDEGLLLRANTNGSLLLHGVYFGAEASF